VTRRRKLTLVQAFGLVAVVTGGAVLLAGWLITRLEQERFGNVGEGLWWAITTITTVGYGDLVPATTQGRMVGAALMLLGIAALAFVTATMATVIVGEVQAEEKLIEQEESEILNLLAELSQRLERLERAAGVEDSA
jgi:voltage-gated potassium channel Kch